MCRQLWCNITRFCSNRLSYPYRQNIRTQTTVKGFVHVDCYLIMVHTHWRLSQSWDYLPNHQFIELLKSSFKITKNHNTDLKRNQSKSLTITMDTTDVDSGFKQKTWNFICVLLDRQAYLILIIFRICLTYKIVIKIQGKSGWFLLAYKNHGSIHH